MLVPLANGKTNKLPIDYRTGNPHDAHDAGVWIDYGRASTLAASWGPSFSVGFVLTAADPFWCLDIDSCREGNRWSAAALSYVAALPNTVVEVSQSGNGLHVWGQGPVPPHGKKRVDLGIELYTERRFIAIGSGAVGDMREPCPTIAEFAARYFPISATPAVTVLDTGPCPEWRGPADDDELLRRAMASRSAASVFGSDRATFADLWHADAVVLARAYPPDASSSEPYDRSSADAALAAHLAFWTGRDAGRIERLMRRSALKREKWDDREDYLVARTIMNACSRQVQVLQDRPIEPPRGVAEPPVAPTAAAAATSTSTPALTAVTGNTYLGVEAQLQLLAGCVYVIEQHRALVPGGMLLKPDQFRARFGGYTWSMDARNERTTRNAWEAFTESQLLRPPMANGTCFRPDLPYGTLVHDAGRTRANTWWPISTPRAAGDPTPFLQHLAKLVPDRGDQEILLSWMACAVQFPGRKFQCAVFIQGVEGNGKSFFSRCLSEILGKRYSFWPDASKLKEKFNAWLFGRLIICVEDIHTENDPEVLERMKPWITGTDGVEIEGKGIDQVTAEICCNFILNSNFKNGVRKTLGDRRYIVFITPQQAFEDLGRDGLTESYHRDLYDWARGGGWAVIHEYLAAYPVPAHLRFDQGLRAPRTTTTDEAIEAGWGRAEQEILEAIEQGEPGFKNGWVSSIAVDRVLDKIHRGNVPRSKRRDLLKSLGYDWHPALPEGRSTLVVAPDAGKPRLYVKKGHPSLALSSPADVVRAYGAAQLAA